MKCTQYYPVLMTDKVAETARFYSKNFRFKPMFEADWGGTPEAEPENEEQATKRTRKTTRRETMKRTKTYMKALLKIVLLVA